jgi:hypothetical protein
MAFDIYLLSKLDYDDAEPLIEGYIDDAIQAFANSNAGQAHSKLHGEGSYWIGTFIELAYRYEGFTLPHMTQGHAQEVMEYILPRKITLLDSSEADDAIDELVAFWTFVDEVYRFRSAKAIAKYLRSIETQFPQWMMDPNRGGMAKTFMMQGIAAGYDMTSPEGLNAFQAEYNQQVQRQSPLGLPPGNIPMTTAPDDMQQVFEQLGIELPAAGQPVNLMALLGQFMGAVEQLDPEGAEQLCNTLEAEATPAIPTLAESLSGLRSVFLQESLGAGMPLSTAEETLLQTQTITETTPGTILQDFQTLLTFIGADGLPVSSKLQHLPFKVLAELNAQLSTPIQIDLKRPQQKSYPNIHGLYLLLRATGIATVVAQGKKLQLRLDPQIHDDWQQLNPTEQYFSLLEAWFIRSHPEMLGEERSGPLMMGDRCLQGWSQFTKKSACSFAQYTDQDRLGYLPGFHNLALMEMFGWLALATGKPAQGKGWRIKKVAALPWGKAIMVLINNAYLAVQYDWPAMTNPTLPFGDLQPTLQPYFPEWQQNLVVPSLPFRAGRHIFKVSLGKVWRRIAITGEAPLASLSGLILDSVDFDSDHLDQFTYKTPTGRTMEVCHPYMDGGDLTTEDVQIGSLPLIEGSTMEYLFDFGDCWKFQVQLETVEEPAPEPASKGFGKVKGKKKRPSRTRKPLGEIIETHGEAPQQYPDYDEDW